MQSLFPGQRTRKVKNGTQQVSACLTKCFIDD